MTPEQGKALLLLAEDLERNCRDDGPCVGTCDRHRVAAMLRALAAPQETPQGWQPIETAPKDGTPFLVCWAPESRMDPERKVVVEMVGGWDEYEEVRSYGEPEAYGWHPLPRALLSPMTSVASPTRETP